MSQTKLQKKIFITGTDTDVGKTFFTAALIQALQKANQSVMALKPIAAGCERLATDTLGGFILRNQDALTLIEQLESSHDKIDYEQINPITLEPPIAPHIAAEQQGIELSVSAIQKQCPIEHFSESFLLVEGAGGWLVPLNEQETLADYAIAESMDVILVVGLKLGCINHALMTRQLIKASGLNLIGWVANHIDKQMLNQQENIESLKKLLKSPLLAEFPFYESVNAISEASKCVRIELLD
ncbi:dethiobiotin synthase [Aliikangiella sp. IMCC44359]|uniref:dethiobiotin synthase n=1 Tax=Aliikangiella sp. IMCC44359 TaxID=3459125 RepID=UPI00403AC4C1